MREVKVRAARIGDLPPLVSSKTKQAMGSRLSLDSQLSDLLRDPAAKAILDKYLPTLTSSTQIGLAPQISLRSMQPYLPEMSEEVARRMESELEALPTR